MRFVIITILMLLSLNVSSNTYHALDSISNGNQKITILRRVDQSNFVVNSDGAKFYRTNVVIHIHEGKKKTDVTIPYPYYSDNSEAMNPCLMIDPVYGKICIFVLDKVKNGGYTMDGYAYLYTKDGQLTKETVFSNKNMGWFSFFIGSDNGNPELWHFNFNGYRRMLSKRTQSGTWNTSDIGKIEGSEINDYYRQHNILLISSSSGADNIAITTRSNDGINIDPSTMTAKDAVIGSITLLGALFSVLTNGSSSNSDNYTSSAITNNNDYIIQEQNGAHARVTKDGESKYSAIINVSDGGIFSSNVDEDIYLTTVSDKNGNIIKKYTDPFKDNGFDCPKLSNTELPGTVTVNYRANKSDKWKTVMMKVMNCGMYTLNID